MPAMSKFDFSNKENTLLLVVNNYDLILKYVSITGIEAYRYIELYGQIRY